jgi:hypothetical protein
MTLVDARRFVPERPLEADLCIVGAGAAGIALAREVIGTRYRVTILESGGLRYSGRVQRLYAGENAGVPSYALTYSRLRVFGGSTTRWAAQCRPLDPIDFEGRPAAWRQSNTSKNRLGAVAIGDDRLETRTIFSPKRGADGLSHRGSVPRSRALPPAAECLPCAHRARNFPTTVLRPPAISCAGSFGHLMAGCHPAPMTRSSSRPSFAPGCWQPVWSIPHTSR